MAIAWSLAPSNGGLFAVKIRGVRTIVFVLHLNQSILSTHNVFELLYCFGRHQSFVDGNQTHVQAVHPRRSRGCVTVGNSAHKTSEHHEWVIYQPTGTGCCNHNQRVWFQYDFVHNGSNFPKQFAGWNVLHSTPIPEDFDAVVNTEQNGVVWRCTGHESITNLPKRHVEVFHPSFNTVYNALETRTVYCVRPCSAVSLLMHLVTANWLTACRPASTYISNCHTRRWQSSQLYSVVK